MGKVETGTQLPGKFAKLDLMRSVSFCGQCQDGFQAPTNGKIEAIPIRKRIIRKLNERAYDFVELE